MIRYTICTYTNIYLREHTNLEFRQTKLDLSAELRLCATRVLIHKENKEYFEYQHKYYKIVVYVHVSYESTRTYKTYMYNRKLCICNQTEAKTGLALKDKGHLNNFCVYCQMGLKFGGMVDMIYSQLNI